MSTHPVSSYETKQRGFIGMEGVGADMDDYNRALRDPALATDSNPANMANTQRVINHLAELKGRIKDQNNPYHGYSEFQKYQEFTRTESSHMAVMRGLGGQ